MFQKKVLIFDDDDDLVTILRFLFEEEGWLVSTFNKCDQAVQTSKKINPDLIIMDNWIPSIGGVEATLQLKNDQELRNVPVIFFSATNNVMELSRKAGADAQIAKPFDIDELLIVARTLTNKD